MILKDPERMVDEYWKLTPKTRLILSDVDYWCSKQGINVVVTSLIRSEEEQQKLVELGVTNDKVSVHQFGRGVDLRLFQPSEMNEELVEYLNYHYIYDPLRPRYKTAMIHYGTALHIHIQSLE